MSESSKIPIRKKVLSKNDEIAATIRTRMRNENILVLNLVSSPGSGKTTLLEKTLAMADNEMSIAIIAGDVQTENDARRLMEAGGTRVRSIVTDGACHLDAAMVDRALRDMDLSGLDVLFIENVGNLVCPSSFDLGEDMKIVLMSVPEGDDKPLKYPAMFRRSSVLVVNKTDLLGHSDFDLDRAKTNARKVNPDLCILEVSCRTGDGLLRWIDWLAEAITQKKGH